VNIDAIDGKVQTPGDTAVVYRVFAEAKASRFGVVGLEYP
jgi:hypothetical protein